MVKPGSQGQGLQGYSFQLTLGRHLSLQKKTKKNNNNPTCRDRCAQSLVRESCSRNNVVEPVGKTSLVLDTVFGHELEKEYTEQHNTSYEHSMCEIIQCPPEVTHVIIEYLRVDSLAGGVDQ